MTDRTICTRDWMADLAAPLIADLDDATRLALPAIPQSLEAALLLGLVRSGSRPIIWIADGPRAMDVMARNLRTLDAGETIPRLTFPPAADSRDRLDAVWATRERLSTLAQLALQPDRPRLILTCIEAVLQGCPAPRRLKDEHRIVALNEEWDRDAMTAFLERTGHRFVSEVSEPGEVAVRGGILDAWPIREQHPFRIEFFGSTIDSIRIFDPIDQRSIAPRTDVHLGLATEKDTDDGDRGGRFTDYWPASAIIAWSRYPDIIRHVALLQKTGDGIEPEDATVADTVSPPDLKRPHLYIPAPDSLEPRSDVLPDDIRFVEGVTAPSDDGYQPDAVDRQRGAFVQRLVAAAATGTEVFIYFSTQGALTHFRKTFGDQWRGPRLHCESGWLSDGVHLPSRQRLLVSEDLLYGRGKTRRRQASLPGESADDSSRDSIGERLANWSDLQPGDLVVHAGHGIGRYQGLHNVSEGETAGEYLIVVYADDARLFVPVSQAHLLSRYVGAARHGVKLHRLGGTRWNRERHAAARAIEDLAAAFVEIQAARQTLPGHAFSADTPWLHDFESAFPFDETPDQAQAIADVLRDMEAPRPMDRLICGDAGYGKTEVAMRAAFKAVMDGKQVAVFVPTTILAQQHFYTFSERMGPYPVRVEMLSRFSSAEDRRRVYEGLQGGAIDIVIGTHALLNPDLRFKDLGLVIIDEEQRFGVMHKERFKHLRRMLDVLTLTATPIPRTLYLSLTGVRELSAIRTPPRDRLAIETEIADDRNAVIRSAILRELSRDGQIYFLHNRVQSIDRVYQRLRDLVPEARIEIAHGQMAAHALSDKMRRFAGGDFDVLLCTTIIESGVDIPSVNTMIIDRADRFGLAELYQLRGRVGRSGVRAHAILLLPRHGLTDPLARKRISALQEYAHPGAGFELALRDLEIRGAGNLLGAEQSGHISAIGFNLYCQLLQRTVAQLKGETVPPLVDVALQLDFLRPTTDGHAADDASDMGLSLPVTYVSNERDRMRLYRRIAEAVRREQIDALRDELRDRFGPLPRRAERLLRLAELRVVAAGLGIQSIETDGAKVMMRRADGYIMTDGRFPRLAAGHGVDQRLDDVMTLLLSLTS